MDHLRKFILKQSTNLIKRFADDVLSTFWSKMLILIWNTNHPFSPFIGSELLLFITNTSTIIVKFLKSNFMETQALIDLCDGLVLWESISPFLVITTIDDETEYQKN